MNKAEFQKLISTFQTNKWKIEELSRDLNDEIIGQTIIQERLRVFIDKNYPEISEILVIKPTLYNSQFPKRNPQ
jgi:hypothetical protein